MIVTSAHISFVIKKKQKQKIKIKNLPNDKNDYQNFFTLSLLRLLKLLGFIGKPKQKVLERVSKLTFKHIVYWSWHYGMKHKAHLSSWLRLFLTIVVNYKLKSIILLGTAETWWRKWNGTQDNCGRSTNCDQWENTIRWAKQVISQQLTALLIFICHPKYIEQRKF